MCMSRFQIRWSRPGSNRGPCACEAHVITTTLRDLPTEIKNCINKTKLLRLKNPLWSIPSIYFLLGFACVTKSDQSNIQDSIHSNIPSIRGINNRNKVLLNNNVTHREWVGLSFFRGVA